MTATERVVRRFLAGTTFQTLFDLHSYMYEQGRQQGWQPAKALTGGEAWQKRFGAVWVVMDWDDSVWATNVLVYIMQPPQGMTYEAWAPIRKERFMQSLKIKGMSFDDLMTVAEGLAKEHKSLAGARPKADRSGLSFKDYQGEEALKRWKEEVEKRLQEIIDQGASGGMDFTTQSLVGNILENYGISLRGMSRAKEGEWISAILNSMAKRRKIEKDTNDPSHPKWLGLNWKSKPRFY